MKGITVRQPWASLLVARAKHWETRSWSTTYRGPLAIHASANYPYWCRELELLPEFIAGLRTEARPLPTGLIIGLGYLADCVPVEKAGRISETEAAYGSWTAGRYAWRIRDVRRLRTPIRYKGSLRLWSIPPGVAVRIESQAAA